MLMSAAGADTKAANVAFGYCSQNATAYCDDLHLNKGKYKNKPKTGATLIHDLSLRTQTDKEPFSS